MTEGEAAGNPTSDAVPARFGPARREIRAFLELVALAGIAIAQPTLDLLSKNSGLFVTRHSSTAQIVALTAIIVLAPAAVMWTIEVLVGLVVPRLRRWVHAGFAAITAGITAIEVANRQSSYATRYLLALAVVCGLIAGVLVLRFSVVRLWLRYLSIAPVIFAALFLFSSPATSVIFDQGPKSPAKVSVGTPSRVVMVVMDEFPLESLLDGTGKIDAALYPNFAALAGGSTWYRNETTVAPNTNEAVPAILSGSYPPISALATAYKYPHNLFTLLGGSYQLNVQETVTHLCPDTMCPEVHFATSEDADGFSGLVRNTWELWKNSASIKGRQAAINFNFEEETHFAPDAYNRGLRFVQSIQPTSKPRLDFLHVLLPHRPWHYFPDAQSYPPTGTAGTVNTAWVDQSVATSARQRHLLQVQTADRLIGRIVAKLKRIHAYDDSLIVFTTDHGVAFTAKNPIRGASTGNYPEIMWTPLFIKAPNQTQGVVDDQPVRSIDVLPTIADMLDVKLPWHLDGHSVLGAPRRQDPPKLLRWGFNRLKPPPGSDYVTVDGEAGFAAAMQGRASTSTADPSLRLYQIGPFGALVGESAAPMVAPTTATVSAALQGRKRFDNVDPDAPSAPWAYAHGSVDASVGTAPVAITVNGVVGAVVQPYHPPGASRRRLGFWGAIPPQLFVAGKNDVRLYIVSGTPEQPQLVPVQPQS